MASSAPSVAGVELPQDVVQLSYFHNDLNRESAVKMVQATKKPGAFLLRPSKSFPGSLAVEVAVERGGQLSVDSLIVSRLTDGSGKWRLNLNAEGTLLAQDTTVAGVFTAAAAFFPFPIHRAGHKGVEIPTHEATPAAASPGSLNLMMSATRGMGDEDTDDFVNMAASKGGQGGGRLGFFDDDTDDVSNFAKGGLGSGGGTA